MISLSAFQLFRSAEWPLRLLASLLMPLRPLKIYAKDVLGTSRICSPNRKSYAHTNFERNPAPHGERVSPATFPYKIRIMVSKEQRLPHNRAGGVSLSRPTDERGAFAQCEHVAGAALMSPSRDCTFSSANSFNEQTTFQHHYKFIFEQTTNY